MAQQGRINPDLIPISDRVQVGVRIRPLGSNPKTAHQESGYTDTNCEVVATSQHTVKTLRGVPQRWKNWTFDHVFSGDQDEVYNCFGAPLLEEALKGYNCCLFAYGQTGSGKTYSILGGKTEDSEGLIPKLCRHLYAHVARIRADPAGDRTIDISAEYVEIYNDNLRDLLCPPDQSVPLQLFEDGPDRRVRVLGITVCPCATEADMANLVSYGNLQRAEAETAHNDRSSRSHCVLLIHIEQRVPSTSDVYRSDIALVDLAGSERADVSAPMCPERFAELKKINRSLSVLGRCLKDSSVASRGMLRESKLTWLLSSALSGGNCKAWMLACCNPAGKSTAVSNVTLDYATTAMSIVNSAIINRVEESEAHDRAAAEREKRREDQRLRAELRDARESAAAVRGDYAALGSTPTRARRANANQRSLSCVSTASHTDLHDRIARLEQRLLESDANNATVTAELKALLREFVEQAKQQNVVAAASTESPSAYSGSLSPSQAVPAVAAGEVDPSWLQQSSALRSHSFGTADLSWASGYTGATSAGYPGATSTGYTGATSTGYPGATSNGYPGATSAGFSGAISSQSPFLATANWPPRLVCPPSVPLSATAAGAPWSGNWGLTSSNHHTDSLGMLQNSVSFPPSSFPSHYNFGTNSNDIALTGSQALQSTTYPPAPQPPVPPPSSNDYDRSSHSGATTQPPHSDVNFIRERLRQVDSRLESVVYEETAQRSVSSPADPQNSTVNGYQVVDVSQPSYSKARISSKPESGHGRFTNRSSSAVPPSDTLHQTINYNIYVAQNDPNSAELGLEDARQIASTAFNGDRYSSPPSPSGGVNASGPKRRSPPSPKTLPSIPRSTY